jgi:hypothetical protein
MSPSIRVDRDVYSFLQQNARPFVDTPNSVLRRLLGLPSREEHESALSSFGAEVQKKRGTVRRGSSKRKPRRKEARGSASKVATPALPVDQFEKPILIAISEHGGSAPIAAVLQEVHRKMKDRFSESDVEAVQSGQKRWETRVHFARLRLAKRGLIDQESPRGIWAISERGKNLVASLSREEGA